MTNEEIIDMLRRYQTKNSLSYSKRGLFRTAADALEVAERKIDILFHSIGAKDDEIDKLEEQLEEIAARSVELEAKCIELENQVKMLASCQAITPHEFYEEMRQAAEIDCDGMPTGSMGKIMCETLRQLGYGLGVAVFENTKVNPKWYCIQTVTDGKVRFKKVKEKCNNE